MYKLLQSGKTSFTVQDCVGISLFAIGTCLSFVKIAKEENFIVGDKNNFSFIPERIDIAKTLFTGEGIEIRTAPQHRTRYNRSKFPHIARKVMKMPKEPEKPVSTVNLAEIMSNASKNYDKVLKCINEKFKNSDVFTCGEVAAHCYLLPEQVETCFEQIAQKGLIQKYGASYWTWDEPVKPVKVKPTLQRKPVQEQNVVQNV